ncbi:xanthine dehydrogenase accessory protein XdhC [Phreatobacter sp. HK31-P]
MEVWPRILGIIETEGACVLVSVLAARGSVPREAGARMIVRPDGGFHGTIGGGTLEWQALARARQFLQHGQPRSRVTDQALGPNLGQCCGGHVTLGFELFDRHAINEVAVLAAAERAGAFGCLTAVGTDGFRRTLLPEGAPSIRLTPRTYVERFGEALPYIGLFGAGHVGRALVLALAPLPFRILWHDQRDGAFPAAVPANVALVGGDPADALARLPDGAQVLVMTHSHGEDLAIVAAALASGRFAHVGLIGSQSKRARFVKRLAALGLAEATARLRCPIGIPGLAGKEPAVIAASVAAECLILRESRSINAGTAARRQNA